MLLLLSVSSPRVVVVVVAGFCDRQRRLTPSPLVVWPTCARLETHPKINVTVCVCVFFIGSVLVPTEPPPPPSNRMIISHAHRTESATIPPSRSHSTTLAGTPRRGGLHKIARRTLTHTHTHPVTPPHTHTGRKSGKRLPAQNKRIGTRVVFRIQLNNANDSRSGNANATCSTAGRFVAVAAGGVGGVLQRRMCHRHFGQFAQYSICIRPGSVCAVPSEWTVCACSSKQSHRRPRIGHILCGTE